jgi:peptidoglycan-associated lipoprotein
LGAISKIALLFKYLKENAMNVLKTSYTTIGAIALTLLLAACGSSAKLDNAAVSDVKPKLVEQVASAKADDSKLAQVATGTVSSSASEGRKIEAVNLQTPPLLVTPPDGARTIYFDYDSFIVRPEFQAALEAHAKYLNADQTRKLMLEGHTDDRGGREYNLALGQKRAEAVQRALSLFGLGAGRVESVSFGKERPAGTGEDEATRAKNRRTELVYK